MFLGIETPVEASLLEAHKGQNTRRDLVESVRKIQGYGMEVMAGFIIGFDTDPIDIFTRQIEFIRDSAIPLAMVGLLNALPNTQLWHRLQKEGRLIADSTGDNTDGSLNFVPRMDSKRLQEGYKSVLRAIYSPAEYYRRSLDCLNRMTSGIQRPRDRGPAASVLAFARIAIALGLRGNARREFWRYLRRVMVEHRDRLGYALTLAAMGHHFRMHVEAYCGRANLEPSALGWRHACEVIWASVTTLTPRGIIRSLSRHHEARRCGGHSGRTASRAILDHPRWRDSHQVDVAAALAALRWRFSTASVAGKPSM